MKKIKIIVTSEDIRDGLKSDPSACAIVLAAKRALPQYSKVTASSYEIFAVKSNYDYDRFQLPKRITQFIRDFDAGFALEPTWFYVNHYTR